MNALKEINHIDIQFQTKALMIRYSLIKPYLVDILVRNDLKQHEQQMKSFFFSLWKMITQPKQVNKKTQ